MALPSAVDETRLLDPFKSELSDETSPLKAVSELSATPDVFIKRDRAEPTMEDVLVVKSLSCVLAFAAILLSTSALTASKVAGGLIVMFTVSGLDALLLSSVTTSENVSVTAGSFAPRVGAVNVGSLAVLSDRFIIVPNVYVQV